MIGLFVFLILSCTKIYCLYILEINLLLVALFTNVFSHSMSCLYTLEIKPLSISSFAVLVVFLFMISFAVQKLFKLIRSYLFIFVFISITLGGGSQRILLWFMSESVLPMFSSKSFIVSGLTFRSLIHFWVYFCVWCQKVF